MGQRNIRTIIRQSPAFEWSEKTNRSPHKRSKNTDGKPLEHNKRISSRQIIWTNLKGKHAQGPGTTNLYPDNMGRSGVMG